MAENEIKGYRWRMWSDTATNLTANNPTLKDGEWAKESDTGKFKLGDGVTEWTALPYASGSPGVTWNGDAVYQTDAGGSPDTPDWVLHKGRWFSTLTDDNTGNTPPDTATDNANWHFEETVQDNRNSREAILSGVRYQNKFMVDGIEDYATYKDAAQAEPEGGTGGTPVAVTIAENVATPIIGDRSLRISKSAADGQGEGCSYDFSIDDGVKGRTVEIPFKYRTLLDYADGDMGVYVLDIDNSILYRPSVVDIPASSNGEILDFFATFLPSATGGNNFRLIFHVQTTNALAWDFDVDDIQVGKQRTVIGDVLRYKPVWGEEIGDTPATSVSVDPSWGVVRISGRRTDTTPDRSFTVEWDISEGINCSEIIEAGTGTSTNALRVTYTESSNTVEVTFTGYTAEIYKIEQLIQTENINLATDFTEYASNSSQTDADDTTSFVYGPGGSEGVIGNTALTSRRDKLVEFKRPIQPTDKISIELYDPTTGIWVDGDLRPADADLVCNHFVYLNANGGMAYYPVDSTHVAVSFNPYPSGNNISDWDSSGLYGVRWRVRKVSNGNMAEEPRMVRAEYHSQAASGSNIDLKYSTKVEDTHNAYDPVTGRFTAPIDGSYTGIGNMVAGNATAQNIEIYKNGVLFKRIGGADTVAIAVLIIFSIRLLAGDYITIRVGSAQAFASDTIAIECTGN